METPAKPLDLWLRGGPPPLIEAEIPPETREAWRAQELGPLEAPEDRFGLVQVEESGISFRKTARVAGDMGGEEGAAWLAAHYSASDPLRWPEDWEARLERWRRSGALTSIAPWHEGFLQALGVRDSSTFNSAACALLEAPARVRRHMESYTEFIMVLLGRALRDHVPAIGVFYEPIASNHAPVIAPALYASFVANSLRRIVISLRSAGVRFTYVRTAGRIESLIPVWLDAGIDGLYVNQTAAARIDYADLRRRFGPRLKLLGGIPWQMVAGGQATRDALRRRIQSLLNLGGAIPYLDDTIRPYIRFDDFRFYRDTLNEAIQASGRKN